MVYNVMSIVAYIFISILSLYFYGRWKLGVSKGPWPLPFAGCILQFAGHLDRIFYRISELVDEYGEGCLLWLGNNPVFFIAEAEKVKTYYTSVQMLDHPFMYDNFKPILGDGLFTANGVAWKNSRKALSPSFHPSVLKNYVQNFQKHADILIEALRDKADGPPFQMFPYLRSYAIDAITHNALEYDLDSQRVHNPIVAKIERLSDLLFQRMFSLFSQNDWFFKQTAPGKEYNSILNEVYALATDVVEKKKQSMVTEEIEDGDWRNNVFVRRLLDRQTDLQKMLDEICTLVVTGHETIARALSFFLHLVALNPEVQEKIIAEDIEVKKILAGREMQLEDLQLYEYTDRVIKESMRLFPVAPMTARLASEDITLGDLKVPKGAAVVCFSYKMHRDPKYFPDPLKFNPDHFLPEAVAKRHPYAYVPFAAGPRNCIGTKYATIALKTVIPTLLNNYRVYTMHKDMHSIDLKLEVTLKDGDGCILRLEKRSK